jgi:hypothetical protein
MDGTKMLVDTDALNALEAAANDAESTRSSFWEEELKDFSFTANGEMNGLIAIGSISRKIGLHHKAANWMLQWPYRLAARKSRNLAECSRLARIVAARQERLFTLDMLRQALALAIIKDNLDTKEFDGANLVIGDGHGVMTSLLKLSDPENVTIAVNLTSPLLIDLVYAQRAIPGLRIAMPMNDVEMREALQRKDIDVIAIRADQADLISEAPIGLAVNIHSMQEMTRNVIESYFSLLRGNKSERTAFYCCNRIYKKLYDGEEIKFTEFPWLPDERILFDEICWWDNFEYKPRPPFWLRNPHPKQHRLTILEKAL